MFGARLVASVSQTDAVTLDPRPLHAHVVRLLPAVLNKWKKQAPMQLEAGERPMRDGQPTLIVKWRTQLENLHVCYNSLVRLFFFFLTFANRYLL